MGRPRKYDTEEDMEAAIVEYFDSLIREDGTSIMPTMAGLALHLGFVSRQSMHDYEKDERFSYLVKKARLSIENAWEHILAKPSCTGAIFWLKNHAGYTDRQDLNHSGNIGVQIIDDIN